MNGGPKQGGTSPGIADQLGARPRATMDVPWQGVGRGPGMCTLITSLSPKRCPWLGLDDCPPSCTGSQVGRPTRILAEVNRSGRAANRLPPFLLAGGKSLSNPDSGLMISDANQSRMEKNRTVLPEFNANFYSLSHRLQRTRLWFDKIKFIRAARKYGMPLDKRQGKCLFKRFPLKGSGKLQGK